MKKFSKLLVISNAEHYFDGTTINIRSGFETQIFAFLDHFENIKFLSPRSRASFQGIALPPKFTAEALDFYLPDGKFDFIKHFLTIRSVVRAAIRSNADADLVLIFLPDSYLGYLYCYELKRTDLRVIVRVTNDICEEFITRKPTMVRRFLGTFLRPFVAAFEANLTRNSTVVFTGKPHFNVVKGKSLTVISSSVSEIDIHTDRDRKPSKIIGFVGRLDQNKGIDIFLETAELLPAFAFEIIGYGTKQEEDNLNARVALCNNVKMLGYQPTKKVLERMRAWDFVLIPSRSEYQGKVQLEAMASGCIVIAHDLPRMRLTIKNNWNGILVKLSAARFSQAVVSLAADEVKCRNIRENAHSYIRNNTIEKMAKEIIDFAG